MDAAPPCGPEAQRGVLPRADGGGRPAVGEGAVGEDAFSRLMAPFQPFETAPVLAVAVSGGADSMALCLLVDRWARDRGGRVVALTVDHRLRPDSAEEARAVTARLAGRGIAAHVLTRPDIDRQGGVQAAARTARYALLAEWCRSQGVLHLLLGHHRDDQAETLLLRLGRGSGLAGLAAMAPVVFRADVRLLRPLLPVPAARLRATCEAFGVPWIEDPGNRNPAFRRVRIRHELAPVLAAEGLTPERLAATAARLGRSREAIEDAVAGLLAAAAAPDPLGFIRLDGEKMAAVPDDVGLRALAAVLVAVGGAATVPRLERLENLHGALVALARAGRTAGGGPSVVGARVVGVSVFRRTLGGCLVVGGRRGVLVCREPAAVDPPVAVRPGGRVRWDGRFTARAAPDAPPGLSVGALGREGWRAVATARPDLVRRPPPEAIRLTLPALFDHEGVLAVPHLGYSRGAVVAIIEAYTPDIPATGGSSCLASRQSLII